jgi:Aspartate/tyrosine/aromatic aminotransferase
MVARIQAMRTGLKGRLQKLGTPGNWDHITNQIGMFSYLGLTCKCTFTAAFTDLLYVSDDNGTHRRFSSSPRKHPDQLCTPPSLLLSSYWRRFLGYKVGSTEG